MSFSIHSFTDWYVAIADSHLLSPNYTQYILQVPLTFTSTNKPFLHNGTTDTDYLFIRAGQTFDGHGKLIFLQNGCQPVNGIAGIFRAYGSSGNTANFTNINIQGDTGLPWSNIGSGSLFISCFSLGFDPTYVNVTNGILQAATDLNETGTVWVINYAGNVGNITLDSVSMYLNGNNNTFGINGFLIFFSGTNSITNCIFYCQEISNNVNNYIVLSASSTSITNCYVYIPVLGVNLDNQSVFQMVNNFSLTNIYIVLSPSYSTIRTSNIRFVKVTGVGSLTNAYTNNNTFNTFVFGGSMFTETNVNPSFSFSSNPFPTNSEWTYTSGPPRLSTFLSAPFNPASYSSYDSITSFLSAEPQPNLSLSPLFFYWWYLASQRKRGCCRE